MLHVFQGVLFRNRSGFTGLSRVQLFGTLCTSLPVRFPYHTCLRLHMYSLLKELVSDTDRIRHIWLCVVTDGLTINKRPTYLFVTSRNLRWDRETVVS